MPSAANVHAPPAGVAGVPDHAADGATSCWMLIHMVEETARHVGHLDTMRELLDGQKGYY
ncbi:MAG TPA: DUF664 domain-containing protein [Blastococcus sp.]